MGRSLAAMAAIGSLLASSPSMQGVSPATGNPYLDRISNECRRKARKACGLMAFRSFPEAFHAVQLPTMAL